METTKERQGETERGRSKKDLRKRGWGAKGRARVRAREVRGHRRGLRPGERGARGARRGRARSGCRRAAADWASGALERGARWARGPRRGQRRRAAYLLLAEASLRGSCVPLLRGLAALVRAASRGAGGGGARGGSGAPEPARPAGAPRCKL